MLWHGGSCIVEDQIAETHMEETPTGPGGAPPAVSQEASLHITNGMVAVFTPTTTKLPWAPVLRSLRVWVGCCPGSWSILEVPHNEKHPEHQLWLLRRYVEKTVSLRQIEWRRKISKFLLETLQRTGTTFTAVWANPAGCLNHGRKDSDHHSLQQGLECMEVGQEGTEVLSHHSSLQHGHPPATTFTMHNILKSSEEKSHLLVSKPSDLTLKQITVYVTSIMVMSSALILPLNSFTTSHSFGLIYFLSVKTAADKRKGFSTLCITQSSHVKKDWILFENISANSHLHSFADFIFWRSGPFYIIYEIRSIMRLQVSCKFAKWLWSSQNFKLLWIY